MAVSRADRRAERTLEVTAAFGHDTAPVALDLLEILEFSWHDCYGDLTPPPEVVADVLVCSDGRLDKMIQAVRLALADSRDLRLRADAVRAARDS